jgi:TP901 family phage tail tape measure protein
MPGSFNLGTAAGKIIIDGSGAEKGFGVASAAAQGFYSVLESKVNMVKNVGKGLLGIGSAGAAGIGMAVRAASNFSSELSAVKAVSGATEEQMKKISDAALRIGKDTAFSATEAASAMEELVKAGLSVEDILGGAADATVALAAAGQIDLPKAAEIAANAMNNFKLKGSDMPRVADLIAGAANASAISVEEFAYSLSQSGAVAAISGLKFDDLAVAIAEMGNAGIKGSDAGTSIKTFLTNLIPTTEQQTNKFLELGLMSVDTGVAMKRLAKEGIKPASTGFNDIISSIEKYNAANGGAKVGTAKAGKEALKMAQSLGVVRNQFFDAQGNLKSFSAVQDILQKSTAGLTKEQKLGTLQMLFGTDAIRAAAVMADNGAAGFDKMATSMGKVKAADVAATRLDNLKGSIEQLKGSFETMMITIGNVFLPMVRKVVDAVTWVVNIFNKLPDGVQKAIAILLGLVTAFSLVTGAIITLAFALAPMILQFLAMRALKSVFSIFTVGFKAFREGATVAEALAKGVTRGVEIFTKLGRVGRIVFGILSKIPGILGVIRTAVSFVFGPWGLAIALVVTGLILLYNKFKPFHDLVNKVAGAIKTGLITALQTLQKWWQLIVAGFSGASSGALKGPAKFMVDLGNAARVLWGYLIQLGQAFMQYVVPALQAVGGQLLQALVTAFNQIKDAVVTSLLPALQQLGNTFMTQILPALQQLWAVLWPVIKVIGQVAGIIIGVLLMALFQWYKFLITYILPALITVVGWLLGKLIPVIAKVIVVIIQIVAWLLRFASAIIVAVVNAIKAVVAWFISFGTAVRDAVVTAFNWVKNAISAAMDFVKGVIQTALNVISGIWQAVWGMFGPLVIAVWELIKAVVGLGLAVLTFLFNTWVNVIKAVWGAVWNGLVIVFQFIWGQIVQVVTFYFNLIKTIFTTVLTFLQNLWNTVWNFIVNVATTVWNAIWNVISGPLNRIKALVSSVVGWIQSFISSKFNGAKNDATGAFEGIRKAISDKINAAKQLVSDAVNTIKGFFSGAASWLYNAGRNIIQGLIDGITSMIKSVTDKLKSLTDLIPKSKGPPKRDRQLLRNNGQLILQSLMQGIDDETGNLTSQLNALTRSIPMNIDIGANMAGVARGVPAGAGAGGQGAGLRMVGGTLGIDPSGRAYIQGAAQEVMDTEIDYNSTLTRMGGF